MEGPRRVEVPLDSSSDSVNLIVTVSIRYQFGYLNLHARLSLSVPGIKARSAVAKREIIQSRANKISLAESEHESSVRPNTPTPRRNEAIRIEIVLRSCLWNSCRLILTRWDFAIRARHSIWSRPIRTLKDQQTL